ncbi:MAG: hypothetical protein GXP50_04255 [Deltaproteobacteria bacterium]|nr:hypothetical protein [Deltaproteobacteria bacterium]
MPEWALELRDLVWDRTFVPLALAILLTATVGSGLWRTRWGRTAWFAGLVLTGATLYLGLARHEWGEVLFNGQLL